MALQKSIEKDDLLTRMRVREVAMFGLIALAAILAQLPHEILEDYGINRNWLLGVLGCGIVLGLFFYLRFFFFLAVVLLILGANLDQQIAEYVNISKIPLVLALVAMVGISLINYVVKLMPTGLEPKPREKSAEEIRAMFYGIEKNNVAYVKKVLAMNFDPNVRHDNGHTPLAYAAMRGDLKMIDLLLRNGADVRVSTVEGDTPVELALRMGHSELANQLKRVRVELEARVALRSGDVPTEMQPG